MIDYNKEDGDFIEKLRSRDRLAFNTLYNSLYPQVYRFCKKIIKEDIFDMAADISINSITKYWDRADQFESLKKIKSFILLTAKNECFNHLDRIKTRRRHLKTLDSVPAYDPFLEHENRVSKERIESLVIGNAVFKGQLGRVFKLRFIDGLKIEEVAKELNIKIGTVHSHSAKAIKKLRKKFPKHD